jgi:hypothetical protein
MLSQCSASSFLTKRLGHSNKYHQNLDLNFSWRGNNVIISCFIKGNTFKFLVLAWKFIYDAVIRLYHFPLNCENIVWNKFLLSNSRVPLRDSHSCRITKDNGSRMTVVEAPLEAWLLAMSQPDPQRGLGLVHYPLWRHMGRPWQESLEARGPVTLCQYRSSGISAYCSVRRVFECSLCHASQQRLAPGELPY